MSLYARDIVSFDIVPPLRHVGAKAKERNWIRAQPQSGERHVEEREQDRFLASVDGVLSEDRRQLANRSRPGLSAYRSGERQGVAESRALRA